MISLIRSEIQRNGLRGGVTRLIRETISSAGESSDLFLGSLLSNFPKKAYFTSTAIFIFSFVLFAILTPNALINGDAAVYGQQIANRDFSMRSVHLGYYLAGVPFTSLVPGPVDYILNLMNGMFGAATIALIYLMSFSITGKHIPSVVSSLFLGSSYIFVVNAMYAEIYAVHLFFFVLAIQLWLLNKPALTGLSFALSFLVTPSAILALPTFIILRPHRKALIQFGLTWVTVLSVTIVGFGIVFAPNLNEFLFGDRSILEFIKFAQDGSEVFNIRAALTKEGYEVFLGFFVVIPFVMIGVAQIMREKRLQIFGMAIFSQGLIFFLTGERFGDVPVQLPTYALLCLVGGLGFHFFTGIFQIQSKTKGAMKYLWLYALGALVIVSVLIYAIKIEVTYTLAGIPLILPFSFIPILILFPVMVRLSNRTVNIVKAGQLSAILGALIVVVGINGALILSLLYNKNHEMTEYRTIVNEIGKVASPGYRIIGGWTHGILFEHYMYGQSYTGIWVDLAYLYPDPDMKLQGRLRHVESVDRWEDAVADNREFWILNGWDEYPTVLSDLEGAGYAVEQFHHLYRAYKPELELQQD